MWVVPEHVYSRERSIRQKVVCLGETSAFNSRINPEFGTHAQCVRRKSFPHRLAS